MASRWLESNDKSLLKKGPKNATNGIIAYLDYQNFPGEDTLGTPYWEWTCGPSKITTRTDIFWAPSLNNSFPRACF